MLSVCGSHEHPSLCEYFTVIRIVICGIGLLVEVDANE